MMDCMGFTAFYYFYPYRVVEKVVTYPDVKYLDLFFGVYNGWKGSPICMKEFG